MLFAGPGSRTPVTGAPYSAVQVTQFQQTLEGGNQVSRQQQTKVYRDSQGRVRMERAASADASGEPANGPSVSIFDPVAGNSYVLNPQKLTAFSGRETVRPGSETEYATGDEGRAGDANHQRIARDGHADYPNDPGRRHWERAADSDRA
jgi:hypothetical protein